MQRARELERMGRAVQEIGVAERDVARARRDLSADVGHHDVFGDDAKATLVHRHHWTVAAQVLAAAAAFGESGDPLRAIGQDQLRIARERGQPRAIGRDERHLVAAYQRFPLRRDGAVRAQALREIEQRRLELAAEHGGGATRAQERLVHGGVEAIHAKMGAGREPAHLGQRLDGDPGRGVHADVERDQTRVIELGRVEPLQREVDAFDVEAGAREPRGRRRQRERLATELVGVDQDDLEEPWRARRGRRGLGADAGGAHGRRNRRGSWGD